MKKITTLTENQAQGTCTDRRLSGRDYYQIFTSALMAILGIIILLRSTAISITIMPLLVGGGFLALGLYRFRFVWKYWKEKKWDHK